MRNVHWEKWIFGITKLDGHDIFLGYDWLMDITLRSIGKQGEFGFRDVQKNANEWNGLGGVHFHGYQDY